MEIFDYQYFLIFSSFNNSVFLSERETADRNYALSYYMKENKCFPKGFNLQECLDFYFQVIKKSRQKSTLKSVPQFPYFLCVFCILHFSPFAQFRAICAKIQTIRIWIFTPKIISIFKSFPQFPIWSFFSFCPFFEIFAYLREISNDSNLNFCAKNQYYLKSGPQFPHFQRFHHNILFFWRNFRVISNDTFVGSGIRIDICQFFDIRCFSRPAQWKWIVRHWQSWVPH